MPPAMGQPVKQATTNRPPTSHATASPSSLTIPSVRASASSILTPRTPASLSPSAPPASMARPASSPFSSARPSTNTSSGTRSAASTTSSRVRRWTPHASAPWAAPAEAPSPPSPQRSSPRIAATGVACYTTSFDELLSLKAVGPQDAEQSIPGFIAPGPQNLPLDFPDWIEIVAPRPYAVLATYNDMFPFAGARTTVIEARRFYSLFDPASAAAEGKHCPSHTDRPCPQPRHHQHHPAHGCAAVHHRPRRPRQPRSHHG